MDTAESDMADARKRSQAKGGTSGDESARMYDESGGQMLEQYSTCLDCELDDTVDIDQKHYRFETQAELEKHKQGNFHCGFRCFVRATLQAQQADPEMKLHCLYCPVASVDGGPAYNTIDHLVAHVKQSNAEHDGDLHDQKKAEGGWYSDSFYGDMDDDEDTLSLSRSPGPIYPAVSFGSAPLSGRPDRLAGRLSPDTVPSPVATVPKHAELKATGGPHHLYGLSEKEYMKRRADGIRNLAAMGIEVVKQTTLQRSSPDPVHPEILRGPVPFTELPAHLVPLITLHDTVPPLATEVPKHLGELITMGNIPSVRTPHHLWEAIEQLASEKTQDYTEDTGSEEPSSEASEEMGEEDVEEMELDPIAELNGNDLDAMDE